MPDLTLECLNEATQAWVEFEYNRAIHSETGQTPLARFLAGPDVPRPSPDSAALRLAFTAHRAAYPAAQRRHGGDRGAPLRSAQPLPASDAC